MSNQLSLEDFKDIKLNPNATPFEVLVVVAQVARQKLKNKANAEANSSSSAAEENNAQQVPLQKKKRKKSSAVKHNDDDDDGDDNPKANHIEISSEEWVRKFTEKRRREDIPNAPPLPEEFKARIIEKCGGMRPNRIIHIYQKTLYGTDVNKQHGRLTMCCNKIESFEFLKDDEITSLRRGGDIKVPLIHKPEEGNNGGVLPLTETTLTFKQWDLHKSDNDPQKISYQYVLNGGWNKIVSKDKLEKGHTIDVWAFRDSQINKLCMALVKQE